MKKIYIFSLLLIFCSCASIEIKVPNEFVYTEIQTKDYTLVSWQKIVDKSLPIRIYIEGDGNAYNSKGYATNNPTPKSYFLRNVAFNDTNENVVYLARPCQYIKNKNFNSVDWTTGRFSQKIVDNMAQAIKQIAGNTEIILIGYSGGALLSGLIISQYQKELNVVKWITISGLLNHTKWTNYFNYVPLKDSLDLEKVPNISQKHYIAKQDEVIPYQLTLEMVDIKDCVIVEDAKHSWKNLTITTED